MKQLKKMILGLTLALCVMGLAACGTNKNNKDTNRVT